MLGLCAARRLSLAVESRATPLCGAQARGSLASVFAALGLHSAGSVAVAHKLSCSAACGISPDRELNPCPLTTGPPGKSLDMFLEALLIIGSIWK